MKQNKSALDYPFLETEQIPTSPGSWNCERQDFQGWTITSQQFPPLPTSEKEQKVTDSSNRFQGDIRQHRDAPRRTPLQSTF